MHSRKNNAYKSKYVNSLMNTRRKPCSGLLITYSIKIEDTNILLILKKTKSVEVHAVQETTSKATLKSTPTPTPINGEDRNQQP
jgi:hypothetical protein